MITLRNLCTWAACHALATAAAQTPLGVTDLHGVWNDDNTVTLTFEAPRQGLDASMHLTDLTEITYITIARGALHQAGTVITAFSQPAPGEVLSYTDSDVTPGEVYNYTVTTYVDDKHDDGVNIQVSNLQYPAPVTEAKAVTDHGKAPVTISFRAPSVDIDGKPLKALSRITVKKYDTNWNEVTVKNVSKPTPGEAYSVVDATAPEGSTVYYYITPYTSDGSGYATTAYCFVGEDNPDAVNDLSAEVDGEGVHLSWQANELGVNHGYVDGSTLTYTVQRRAEGDDLITIAEGLTTTAFTDDSDIVSLCEQHYTYQVYSQNDRGQSPMATIIVTVGTPAALPWSEGFDTRVYTSTTCDNGGWTLDPQWVTNGTAYDINGGQTIRPYAGEGLAYVAYNNKTTVRQSQAMTSPHLDTRWVSEVVISLQYYAMTGGYDNEIAIEASADDGDFVRLATLDYSAVETDQWRHAQADLSALLPAATLRIRIIAIKGANSTLAAIDDIQVVATATGIHTLQDGADHSHMRYSIMGQPLNEQRQQGASRGLIIEDGRIIMIQ